MQAYVLEAVDPLAALAALPADVHHSEDDRVEAASSAGQGLKWSTVRVGGGGQAMCEVCGRALERVLDDAGGGHADAQDVLQRGQVAVGHDPVERVQVAASRAITITITITIP